jgi:hypothetical protein
VRLSLQLPIGNGETECLLLRRKSFKQYEDGVRRSLQPEDVHASVVGEIGLAWGISIEEFQEQGHPPERARVRFSKGLAKGAKSWEVLLYHRDIQPFNEDGRYPRALTEVPPTTLK